MKDEHVPVWTCMIKIVSVTPATIFPFIIPLPSSSASHLCCHQQCSRSASNRATGAQKPPGLEVSWSEHVLVPALVRFQPVCSTGVLHQAAQPGNGNLSYQQQGGICAVLCFEQRSEPVTLSDTDWLRYRYCGAVRKEERGLAMLLFLMDLQQGSSQTPVHSSIVLSHLFGELLSSQPEQIKNTPRF